MELEENLYSRTLLEKAEDVERGLKYYIEKTEQLEHELKLYQDMYEHRVDESILLKLKIEDKIKELTLKVNKYQANTRAEETTEEYYRNLNNEYCIKLLRELLEIKEVK